MKAVSIMNEQIRRNVLTPFWVKNPLLWRCPATGRGIAAFAEDGRVGLFNLAWLMVNTDRPPPGKVYTQRDIPWLILHAPNVQVSGQSLEEMAAFNTLQDFADILITASAPHPVPVAALLLNAKRKLQADEHHLRR